MALAAPLVTTARVAAAFSCWVRAAADFLPVSAIACCSIAAAEIDGTSNCRESYSPRNPAAIRSRTSSVPRPLNAPRSAARATTCLDMPAALSPANPSWANMSPNEAAEDRAAALDRPKDRAALAAQACMAVEFWPNTMFVRLTAAADSPARSIDVRK